MEWLGMKMEGGEGGGGGGGEGFKYGVKEGERLNPFNIHK